MVGSPDADVILTGLEEFFEPITDLSHIFHNGKNYNITIVCHNSKHPTTNPTISPTTTPTSAPTRV